MSVQTKLQYLKPLKMWDDIKPYQIIGRRSPGQPRENIELQAYTSTILDVKSLDHTPSLDNEGFQWIYNELTDDLADEAGTKNHLQAMENFLKGFFGAKGVVTYDYQVLFTSDHFHRFHLPLRDDRYLVDRSWCRLASARQDVLLPKFDL